MTFPSGNMAVIGSELNTGLEYYSLPHPPLGSLSLSDFTCVGEASSFRVQSSACVPHPTLKGLLAFSTWALTCGPIDYVQSTSYWLFLLANLSFSFGFFFMAYKIHILKNHHSYETLTFQIYSLKLAASTVLTPQKTTPSCIFSFTAKTPEGVFSSPKCPSHHFWPDAPHLGCNFLQTFLLSVLLLPLRKCWVPRCCFKPPSFYSHSEHSSFVILLLPGFHFF